MMKRGTWIDVLLLLLFVSLATPASGQTGLVNGDFSIAMEPDWTVHEPYNVQRLLYNTADPTDGFVLFTESGDPSEDGSVLVGDQLPVAAIYQDFQIPVDPVNFSFRFYFAHGTTSTPPASEDRIGPDIRPPDSFSV